MSTPSQQCSAAAALSVERTAANLERNVMDYVMSCGERGATCDETELFLGGSHQGVSPRFTSLHRMGRIVETGEKRRTRSGRFACVWRAAQ